eukprot:CAMPEP_0114544988 /NCGR_PEP_ID=MMETSP0114-20121206/3164_1 /TAXON_ID=31324 /ORGANISM="Goniomonas sp, Strain m" /LENGTH=159 /DNA_ID=CAMNT_0001729393 /DNA_START=23 /DNA_END=502 /DNA_ORIENTATION=+
MAAPLATEVLLRPGTITDLPFFLKGVWDVYEIEGETHRYNEEDEAALAKSRLENNGVLIATHNDVPVGLVSFCFSSVTPFGVDYGAWSPYAWISFAYTIPEWRRRGVSKKLYSEVERIALEKGVKEIQLDVFSVNEGSDLFHRKLGYRPYVTLYTKSLE